MPSQEVIIEARRRSHNFSRRARTSPHIRYRGNSGKVCGRPLSRSLGGGDLKLVEKPQVDVAVFV